MPLFRNEAPLRRSHLPKGKEQVNDEIFAKQYGFFRPYVRQVIYR